MTAFVPPPNCAVTVGCTLPPAMTRYANKPRMFKPPPNMSPPVGIVKLPAVIDEPPDVVPVPSPLNATSESTSRADTVPDAVTDSVVQLGEHWLADPSPFASFPWLVPLLKLNSSPTTAEMVAVPVIVKAY